MYRIETNSWFSMYATSPEIFKDASDEVLTDETVIRAEKLTLVTNQFQHNVLIGIVRCTNKFYNFAIDVLRYYIRNRKTLTIPSEYTFRDIVKANLPKNLIILSKQLGMSSVMCDEAIVDAHKAYKSASANKKKGNIKRFRMRYRRNDVGCFCVTSTSFAKSKEGFNVNTLGEMKSFKTVNGKKIPTSMKDINVTCRVILRQGTFYLMVTRRVNKIIVNGRKELCSIDPGARKFLVLFDGENYVIICDNSKKIAWKLYSQLCFIKNNKIWSQYKENNIKKHIKYMDSDELSAAIVEKYQELYPREVELLKQEILNNPNIETTSPIPPPHTDIDPDEAKRIQAKKRKQKKRNLRNRKNHPRKRPKKHKRKILMDPFRLTNKERQLNRAENERKTFRKQKPKKQTKKGTKIFHKPTCVVDPEGNVIRFERVTNIIEDQHKQKVKLQEKLNDYDKTLKEHAVKKYKKAVTSTKKQNVEGKRNAKRNKEPYQTIPDPVLEEFKQNELNSVRNTNKRHKFKVKKTKETRSLQTKIKRKNRRIRRKMTNMRDDLQWKASIFITRNYDNNAYGNMNTKSIIRKQGNLNSFTKKWFAFLSNCMFGARLEQKCEQYNCNRYITDEYRTSKACSDCGELNNVGASEIYKCSSCGLKIDRDYNGAKNIMKVHKKEFIHKRPSKIRPADSTAFFV